MADGGYGVAGYRHIDPAFGTLAEGPLNDGFLQPDTAIWLGR
jgi:hypothetical protein